MSILLDKTIDYTLEISNKTYEELYSKADILYFLLDSQGLIQSCNITAEQRLEWSKKELVGKKFLSFVFEPALPIMESSLNLCYQKGYIKDFDTRLLKGDGQDLPIRLNGLVQNDEEGNVLTVRLYAVEMSERIQLKDEKELLLKILSRIQSEREFNRKIKTILNDIQLYTKSEGMGLFFKEQDGQPLNLVTWKDTDIVSSLENDYRKWNSDTWQRILHAIKSAPSAQFTANGSFWTESLSDLILEISDFEIKDALISLSNFESIGVIQISEDHLNSSYLIITHRKKCRWSEDRMVFLEAVSSIFNHLKTKSIALSPNLGSPALSILMQNPFVGMLILKNGKIDFVNTWVEDWTGSTQQELHDKDVSDLFTADCVSRINRALSETVSFDASSQDWMIKTKEDNSRSFFCSVTRYVEAGDQKQIWYWMPKPEKIDFQEQLVHAKRMEYLGMLAGSLVLDFNNLLSCILGYTSLLNEEISKDSPYYEDLQQISKTAEKATELTSRLLASAQGTSYVMDDLDCNMLVKEVAAYLSKTLNKNIVIRAEMDPKLEKIHADASQIQQAILQIALNARDAMPKGGKLFFQTRNYKVSQSDTHFHAGSQPGDYIQIAVSDTGSGMSGDWRDRFIRQSSSNLHSNTGRGLGLTLIRQIVENHKGFVSVFSEPSKGTLFKIHFPITEKKKGIPAAIASKPGLGKETILLIDDEVALQETARKMLTRYGYKVLSANNGTEALAVYKKYIDRIDLIILDLFMPGMEIHKILAWFRKLNPRVKILAASGMNEQNAVDDEIQESVIGFVRKPFQLRPLLKSIHDVFNA